jgi:hypothetical protein
VNNVYRYCSIVEVQSSRTCRVAWDGAGLPLGVSTTLWEEGAMGPARGYPRSVCVHQQRLVFGGFRDAPSYLALSKAGQFRNFDLGEAKDADAIGVQSAGGVRAIRHVISGVFLTVLTENGISYVPIDPGKPLTPTSIMTRALSPHGSSHTRPGNFDGGILMVVRGGNAVRDLSVTEVSDNLTGEPVSLQATGFLGQIIDAAYLSGSTDRPEHLALFVNAVGRIVVFHSVRSQKIGAWFEWTTLGTYIAIAVAGAGNIFAVVERRTGQYLLEQFDPDAPFDCTLPFGPGADPAAPLVQPYARPGYYGHAIDSSGDYLGTGAIFGPGNTFRVTRQGGELPSLGTGQGEHGIAFGWWIDPLPPAVDMADGTLLLRTQRLIRSSLRLQGTQAAVNDGQALVLRRSRDPVQGPAPPASYWWSTRHLGWARTNEVDAQLVPRITRDVPLPVVVLAMKREVKV